MSAALAVSHWNGYASVMRPLSGSVLPDSYVDRVPTLFSMGAVAASHRRARLLLVEEILVCFTQPEVEEVVVSAYILFTQLCTPRRL